MMQGLRSASRRQHVNDRQHTYTARCVCVCIYVADVADVMLPLLVQISSDVRCAVQHKQEWFGHR